MIINYDDLDGIMLEVDKPKISQVLRNLVSNAIKFSPPGSDVTVHTSVTKDKSKSDQNDGRSMLNLRISVEDSGAGMSPENQLKLFKTIIQFHPGLLQEGKGSGLGLFISKGITDLHKGKISVYSPGEGLGSIFYLDLQCYRNRENMISNGNYHINGKESLVRSPLHLPKKLISIENNQMNIDNSYNNDCKIEMKSSIRTLRSGRIVEGSGPRSADSGSRALSLKGVKCVSSNSIEDSVMDNISPPNSDVLNRGGISHRKVGTDRMGDNNCYANDINGNHNLDAQTCNNSMNDHVTTQSSTHVRKRESMSSRLEVLVVDDSAMNRKMMVRLLKMSNICDSPFQAGDGSDAVKIVIEQLSAQLKRRKKAKKNSHLKECNIEDEICTGPGNGTNGSTGNGTNGSTGAGNGTNGSTGNGTNGSTGEVESPLLGDCNEGAIMSSVPDVILLDYVMPIMNGPEATKLMREAGYGGLIIGVTGNALPADVDYFLDSGANAVLTKPVDTEKLKALFSLK